MHYAFKYVINPVMRPLLRSRLHHLVSEHLLLLTFTGRKSGKRFTTPVGYTQEGDMLYLTTESPWWMNLRGGAPVTVRLRGEQCHGYAEVETDPQEIARIFQRELEERGIDFLRRRYRLDLDAEHPTFAQLVEAARGTVSVRIRLDGQG
jgi:hypothetical protein